MEIEVGVGELALVLRSIYCGGCNKRDNGLWE